MAGLLDLLGLGQSMGAGGGGLLDGIRDRSNQFTGLGAGLLSGNDWQSGLSQGFQSGALGKAVDNKVAEKKKADNATKAWLATQQGLDPASKAYLENNPEATGQLFAASQIKPQASFGVIGEDAYGNKQYGWIDQQHQSVTPNAATAGTQPVGGGMDPDMPQGADPREWRKLSTQREAKKQAALESGLQPGTDAYNNYMLGRPPVQQKPLTGDQANAQGFSERMQNADGVIDKLGQSTAGVWNSALGMVPGGNYLKGADAQQVDQAKRSFITAQLRKESGAAISDGEFATADKQYFPQPGDGPEVIAQKKQERRVAIENMRRAGSNAPGSGGVQSTASPIYTAPDGTTVEEMP